MTQQIPHTEAIKGQVVTTICSRGGTGIGYLVDGEVYKTTGSYFAKNAKDGPFPMIGFVEDGGHLYRNKVSDILGLVMAMRRDGDLIGGEI